MALAPFLSPVKYSQLCAYVFKVRYEGKIPDEALTPIVREYNGFNTCTTLTSCKLEIVDAIEEALRNKIQGRSYLDDNYRDWCRFHIDDYNDQGKYLPFNL